MFNSWRGLLPDDVVLEATSPIYHYTTPAGFLGLVQSRELWATEASGLNDVAEVRQGWEYIRTWMKDQKDSHTVFDSLRAIVDSADEDGDDENASISSPEGIFICSASILRDDANQWRLYGGGARGYSVELDPRVPLSALAMGKRPAALAGPQTWESITTSMRDTVPVTPWLHVLYEKREKEQALDGLAVNAIHMWDRWEAYKEDNQANDDLDLALEEIADRIAFDLARLAQLMKSEGFSGEREVRIIASDRWVRTAHFMARPQGVVRYSRLTSGLHGARRDRVVYENEIKKKKKSLPIRSVQIGPLIRAENNAASVRGLLRKNGLEKCSVEPSNVPLSH